MRMEANGQEKAPRSPAEEMQAAILDALPANVALLDGEGVILAVNEGWRRFAAANGFQGDDFCVGRNYLGVCGSAQGDCAGEAGAAAEGIRRVLDGKLEEFSLEYPCHSPGKKRWFRLVAATLGKDRMAGVVVMHLNVTELRQTAESLSKSQALLRIAGDAARLGGWSVELPAHRLTWSDEVCRIHEMPAGSSPSLKEAIGYYAPEYRDELARRLKLCEEDGTPFDYEAELITAKKRRIWVRAIGEAAKDETNRIRWIRGAFQDISRQKAAEEEARSAGDRLLDTVESITDGFFTLDRGWRFTYVNAEAEKILGRDRTTLLGRTVWETYPQIIGTVFEHEYRRAMEENRTVTFEEYYPPLDMWMEMKAYPSSGALAVYFRDVSQRHHTLAALEASESKYLQLVESNVLGIMSWDAGGIFCDANDTFLQMFGYSREDLQKGRIGWQRMTPPDSAEACGHGREETWSFGHDSPVEREFLNKDGHPVAVMVGTAAPDGKEGGGIGYMVDISAQKRSESKLRASEREFRNLAESMPQIVWVARPDGSTTYINRNWTEYTGLSLGENKSWINAVHPDDMQRALGAWQGAIATSRPCTMECRLLRADGKWRWWLIRGEPQRDTSGQVLKWFGTCTDIHDLKVAEMEITRTNRALKLLSGCNAALIHAEDEMTLLRDMCKLAVETGGYRMAWVGYAHDDESIRPMAHAGLEDGYLDEIRISWDAESPAGNGPGGRAIRSGKAVICGDLVNDPDFHWADAAKRRGYRAVICLPLRDKRRTFGLLGLYSAEPNDRNAEEERLLQEMADDLAFGIINIRDRQARRRMRKALVNVSSAVSASTGSDFFELLAASMAEALGAQASFVAKILPDGPLRAETIAAVVDGRPAENFVYVLDGTPCQNLADSDSCIISTEVAQQFSRSPGLTKLRAQSYVGRRLNSSTGKFLGLLFVLFREPLQEPDLVDAMLRIFAARAAAELERQETDGRLREQAALLDKAQDAILVRDLDHRILYWNNSAERLYGWTAAEALGRSARDLIYRSHGVFDSACETLLSCGEWVGEIEQVTKDGKVVTVECHWSLVSAEQGNARSVLAINTDITERKKIEAQYFRAQRMESIGTLAGGIAHDLNNVLAPIMMAIGLLKLEEKDGERLDILNIIESSAKRGADMVSQVLSFARGVEGRQLQVEAGTLIGEILTVVRDTFPKNIEVRSDIAPGLWMLRGDPTQLHQVLLNLCLNARDAMPQGGTLNLTAGNVRLDQQYAGMHMDAKPGPHVCIQVEDTGTGIPPETVERIFEPFFTTKEPGKGTGLGLSTSLAIIRGHGGFVRVQSEPGTGTGFHVYFPAQTDPEMPEDGEEPADMPRGKGELVLVVDDEAAVREITRQTLEAFGYRVVLASDGVDATSIYASRKQEIAIVLTDMMMPLMDGPTTIQVLLKLNPDVRIIAASGLNTQAMAEKAHSTGIRHFIPKPYTAETLLKTLRAALED